MKITLRQVRIGEYLDVWQVWSSVDPRCATSSREPLANSGAGQPGSRHATSSVIVVRRSARTRRRCWAVCSADSAGPHFGRRLGTVGQPPGRSGRRAAVGLVGQQGGETAPGTARPPGDWRVAVEQVECATDVGHVRAAGQNMDRGAVTVADQMMLAAGFAAVAGEGPVPGPAFSRRCDYRPSPCVSSRSGSPR